MHKLLDYGKTFGAGLDEVVVCEHEEVCEGCSARPSTHRGGDEVLQRGVEGKGEEQVLLLHFEASCVV